MHQLRKSLMNLLMVCLLIFTLSGCSPSARKFKSIDVSKPESKQAEDELVKENIFSIGEEIEIKQNPELKQGKKPKEDQETIVQSRFKVENVQVYNRIQDAGIETEKAKKYSLCEKKYRSDQGKDDQGDIIKQNAENSNVLVVSVSVTNMLPKNLDNTADFLGLKYKDSEKNVLRKFSTPIYYSLSTKDPEAHDYFSMSLKSGKTISYQLAWYIDSAAIDIKNLYLEFSTNEQLKTVQKQIRLG